MRARSNSASNLTAPRRSSSKVNVHHEMAKMKKQKGSNKIATSRSGYLFANNYKGVTVYKNPEDNMYAGYLQAALSRVNKNEMDPYKNDGIPFNHAPRFAADYSLSQASPGPVYLPTDYATSTEAGRWSFGGGPTTRDGFVFGAIHKGVAAPASKSKSTGENISPADYDSSTAKDKLLNRVRSVSWGKSSTRRFALKENSYDLNPGPKYMPTYSSIDKHQATANFGPRHLYKKKKNDGSAKQKKKQSDAKNAKNEQAEKKLKADLTEEEKEFNREQRRKKREQSRQLKELNRWLKKTTWGGRMPRSIWQGKKFAQEAKGLESPGPIYSIPSENWKLKNEPTVLKNMAMKNVWR